MKKKQERHAISETIRNAMNNKTSSERSKGVTSDQLSRMRASNAIAKPTHSKNRVTINQKGGLKRFHSIREDKPHRDESAPQKNISKPFVIAGGGIGDCLLAIASSFANNKCKILFAPNPSIIKSIDAFLTAFDVEYEILPSFPSNNGKDFKYLSKHSLCKSTCHMPIELDYKHWSKDIPYYEAKIHTKVPVQQLFGKTMSELPIITIAPGTVNDNKNIKMRSMERDAYLQLIRKYLDQYEVYVTGTDKQREYYGNINHRNFRWVTFNSITQNGTTSSYKIEDLFSIINSSEKVLSIDTWLKTYSCMAGVPTIVFQSKINGKYLTKTNDSSDVIFLNKKLWNLTVKRVENVLESPHDTYGLKQLKTDTYYELDSKTTTVIVPDWFSSKTDVDVSIIVPLYKSAQVIEKQIREWNLDGKTTKEIIYIDDNCPNESFLQVIKSWSLRKHELRNSIGRILRNMSNVGYGHSCNIASEYAHGKYLIFLNADTWSKDNWIDPMISRLESDSTIGIVGNMQLKPAKPYEAIDSAGSEWKWENADFDHIRHSNVKQANGQCVTPGEREMVTGACFAIPRDLFVMLHGFDPRFKIGRWEDSDLNLRVREKGYKVFYEPQSIIYHTGNHSGAQLHAMTSVNREYFLSKWCTNGRIDKLVNQKRQTPKITSAYIKRTAAAGDVLAAASIAAAVKKMHPECKITFATACPELLRNNPFIDKIVTINHNELHNFVSRMSHFDVAWDLDMSYEIRPHMPMLEAYADIAGVSTNDCKLFLHTTPIKIATPETFAIIHAGQTAWTGRNWMSERFNEIAQRLKTIGIQSIVIGSSQDHAIQSATMDLRGQTNIYETAHLINNCKLFIGIDSLPMWIAQTFGKHGVCFFGAVNPALRLINDNITPVSCKSLSCIYCHHERPIPSTATLTCARKDQACQTMVTTDVFWQTIQDRLRIANPQL